MAAGSLLFKNDKIYVSETEWDTLHRSVSLTGLLSVLAAVAESLRYGGSFVIYKDEDNKDRRTIGDSDGLFALLEEIRVARDKLGLENLPTI